MITPRLSILIVTYHGDVFLRNCLESIRKKCGEMPEIIVVDNSAQESTRLLTETFNGTIYIPSKHNLGFAGGNNFGLPACHGEYILLLNNDTIICEDPLPQMISYLDSHPQVAVIQGRLHLPKFGGTLDDCGTLLTPFGIQYHILFRQPDPGNLAPHAVFSAKGACLMFRRTILPAVGGILFHGHFGSYYEETDFCHRVWLAGYEVHFVPTPPIDHLLGQTSCMFRSDAIWKQYVSNTLFSFFTLLSPYGLLRILPGYMTLYLLNIGKSLLTAKWGSVASSLGALGLTWQKRNQIKDFRRVVRSLRVISDSDLFRIVMKKPKLRYYYYIATGQAEKYHA